MHTMSEPISSIWRKKKVKKKRKKERRKFNCSSGMKGTFLQNVTSIWKCNGIYCNGVVGLFLCVGKGSTRRHLKETIVAKNPYWSKWGVRRCARARRRCFFWANFQQTVFSHSNVVSFEQWMENICRAFVKCNLIRLRCARFDLLALS